MTSPPSADRPPAGPEPPGAPGRADGAVPPPGALGRLVGAGAPAGPGVAVAVLVHGRDQDAGVMLDLVARWGRSDVHAVLPEAAAGTWYAGRFTDPPELVGEDVDRALAAIEAALVAAREACPGGALVLVGFSQGACLAVERLRRDGRAGLDGVALLTGAWIGVRARAEERPAVPADVAGLPVVAVSSASDAWIPEPYARATAEGLREAGADVAQTITAEPEHRIDDVAVAACARLLARVAGPPPGA